VRFFLSPEGAAVFLPASFFSAGALPAGALPPVVGVFWALGGILSDLVELGKKGGFELKAEALSEMELAECRGGSLRWMKGKVVDGGGRATYGERALML
jgi:hypothetical protein